MRGERLKRRERKAERGVNDGVIEALMVSSDIEHFDGAIVILNVRGTSLDLSSWAWRDCL